MGYSYGKDEGPEMCFNAAQSWQLGWYRDKAATLDETKNQASYVGVLGGIADYSDFNINTVLVKLNTGSSIDYYVNFNRKSGINSGTVEGGNQVTVVTQGGEGTGYAPSELVAKLSAGNTYTISNFDGSGKAATITVNSIGETADGVTVANVSICIGACPTGPTPFPTSSPIPGPTPFPTSSPTPGPTPPPNPPGACADIQIAFRTDGYAYEFSYTLRNASDGKEVWDTSGAQLLNFQSYVQSSCINPLSCYRFDIKDTFGDGLLGSGIRLVFDGAVLYEGGDYGYGGYKLVGGGC
jgi:hypothetical protein